MSGNRVATPEWRLLWAQRRFGDNPDRVCRGSAVAELLGNWPIRAVSVPINRRWIERGGDRQGDAHVPEPAWNQGRFSAASWASFAPWGVGSGGTGVAALSFSGVAHWGGLAVLWSRGGGGRGLARRCGGAGPVGRASSLGEAQELRATGARAGAGGGTRDAGVARSATAGDTAGVVASGDDADAHHRGAQRTTDHSGGGPRSRPNAPRRRGRWCARVGVALAVCLLGTVLFAAHPAAAQESVAGDVRVAARSVAGDRVEFAVQQRDGDGWGERVLPSSRFFPLVTTVGRWLVSSAVDVEGATVRVTAARTDTGRVEFAIQRQTDTGWTQRLLPTSRYFPISTEVGRWLVSSPVGLTATTSGIDEEQACRASLPDTYPDGVDFFCAGANDATNVIRFFTCTPEADTPGFDLVWQARNLYKYSVSPPVAVQAGTRIEWHPDPDCGTHTISIAQIVIDPNRGPSHMRVCRRSHSYTRTGSHQNSRHYQTWVVRLADGRVRLSGSFSGMAGANINCPS